MSGFIVRNSQNGNVLIDDVFSNLQLDEKRLLTDGQHVALGYDASVNYIHVIGDTHGFFITPAYPYDYDPSYTPLHTLKGTCTLYTFRTKEIKPANVGINVRNASTGQLTFSSNIKPLRVVDAIAGDSGMWDGDIIYDKTLPSGRKYGVAFGNLPVRFRATSASRLVTYSPRISINENRVSIVVEEMGVVRAGALRGTFGAGIFNYLIVDLTDY